MRLGARDVSFSSMPLAGIFSFSKEEISVSLIAYLLAICFQVGSLGRLFLLSKSITARLVSASSSCNPVNPSETPRNQVNSRLKQEIERFSYDLEMKAREQNRNDKRTEIE